MSRNINLNVEIPASRELAISLPEDIPVGPAEIVMVVSSSPTPKVPTLGDRKFGIFRYVG